jgi:hypothetical protein
LKGLNTRRKVEASENIRHHHSRATSRHAFTIIFHPGRIWLQKAAKI